MSELVEELARVLRFRICSFVGDYGESLNETIEAILPIIARERGEWQDIAGAPNDNVLVTDGGYVLSGCQNDGKWFSGWVCGQVHIRIDLEPTHWRPLPAPPEKLP